MPCGLLLLLLLLLFCAAACLPAVHDSKWTK